MHPVHMLDFNTLSLNFRSPIASFREGQVLKDHPVGMASDDHPMPVLLWVAHSWSCSSTLSLANHYTNYMVLVNKFLHSSHCGKRNIKLLKMIHARKKNNNEQRDWWED